MKILGRLFVAGVVVFLLLQLIRPSIPASSATAEVQVPPQVKQILEKDCYSCHSNERRLSWFDEIVPGYWLVRHDVLTAREHLNFSTIGSKPAAAQRATLYEAVNMIQLGAMPIPAFRKLHPEANVSPEEMAILKTYLLPWATPPAPATGVTASVSAPVSLGSVSPEFDGFRFDPSFENWKLISTTDRGDNGTFRFILGNDIAINAARSGQVSPWPDGARFAKIAWKQATGSDGLIYPAAFLQVELMLKNAVLYNNQKGWGWGRWLGSELKPFGSDARFVNQCTGCHQPVRGDDYVYTLPISSAKISGNEVLNNAAAALPSSLPYQPLTWQGITMYVDPAAHQTATLFGNEAAMQAVHPRNSPAVAPSYSGGAVLALVTWYQREDPHWFGGRIPDLPKSVEFVQIAAVQPPSYHRFSGAGLVEEQVASTLAAQRTSFILGLTPAPLP